MKKEVSQKVDFNASFSLDLSSVWRCLQGLARRKVERLRPGRCRETSHLDYGKENYSGLCTPMNTEQDDYRPCGS
ncbi:unnamed protein product [Calypogeia fissa]